MDDWQKKSLQKLNEIHEISNSSKIVSLLEIINQSKKQNDKILVFSSYIEVLDLVEQCIQKHCSDSITFYRLDGKTSEQKRNELITKFNDNTDATLVFLLSTKAGGQGINLIGANRIVLLDVSWNPSIDGRLFC